MYWWFDLYIVEQDDDIRQKKLRDASREFLSLPYDQGELSTRPRPHIAVLAIYIGSGILRMIKDHLDY